MSLIKKVSAHKGTIKGVRNMDLEPMTRFKPSSVPYESVRL